MYYLSFILVHGFFIVCIPYRLRLNFSNRFLSLVQVTEQCQTHNRYDIKVDTKNDDELWGD
jgi:hypothetical protein